MSLPTVLGGGFSSPALSSPVIGSGNAQRRSVGGMAPLTDVSQSTFNSTYLVSQAQTAPSGVVIVGGSPFDSHLQILPGESETLTWFLSLTAKGPQELPFITVKSMISAAALAGIDSSGSSSNPSSSSSSSTSPAPLSAPTLPSAHALLTGSSLQVGPNPSMLEDGAAQAIVFSDMLLSSTALPSLAGQAQPYLEDRRWVESTEAPLLSVGGRSAFSIYVVE
jgi:hypothetical protein